jgi:cell division protein FtsB
MRNEGLEAEASDLRNGTLAIEERARYELGMVKQDEIFVQLNPSGASSAAPRPEPSPTVPGPAPGASSGSIDPADAPLEPPRRRAGGVVTVGR